MGLGLGGVILGGGLAGVGVGIGVDWRIGGVVGIGSILLSTGSTHLYNTKHRQTPTPQP